MEKLDELLLDFHWMNTASGLSGAQRLKPGLGTHICAISLGKLLSHLVH